MGALRVAVVTSQLPPDIGGTSVYACEIAKGLRDLGDQVTVVIRDRDPREFAPLGLDVVAIDTKRGVLKPLRLRRARRAVLDLLRERAIDVVHFAYPVSGLGDLYGTLARAGIPFAVGIHGINKSDLASEGSRARRARKWGLGDARAAIALTRWMAEQVYLLGVPRERVHVVHYGVDMRIARESDDDVARERARLGLARRRVVLSLGRLVPRKNFDGVLRVMPAVARRVPDVAYLIVGSGAEEMRWKELARSLGLGDRVVWIPQCRPEEVGRWHKLGDVFVTVSKTRPEDDSYESFGLVYVEANLCGRPVVAGDEAGVPEAVVHGETALLVKPDDDRALEDAIVRLLEDAALRKRMGDAGAARARTFTWERAARATHDVLASVAGAPGHSARAASEERRSDAGR